MKKRIVIILAALAAVVVLAALVGIMFLDSAVKAGVERVGPAVAKVNVKLDAAKLSLFSGQGELRGFLLGNPEGFKTAEAVKVGTVAVSVVPSSIFSAKVVVRSIRVESPEITYETGLKGSNLSKILENIQAVAGSASAGQDSATKSKPLQVDEFVITGGKIHLGATLLGGKTADLPLPELRLTGLGQGPEGITAADLGVKVFEAIVTGTMKAVGESALSLGKDAGEKAKSAGAGAVNTLQKAGGGLTELLKKK